MYAREHPKPRNSRLNKSNEEIIEIKEPINRKTKIYQTIYGDWGLGIGDWGLGIGPNPQSPIPNPPSPIPHYFNFINI